MKNLLTLNLGIFIKGLEHGMNGPGIHQILKADSFKAIPAEIVRIGFYGVTWYHIGVTLVSHWCHSCDKVT